MRVTTVVAVVSTLAVVQPSRADTERTAKFFVERYHCEVTARLQTLYSMDLQKQPRDRYIILSPRHHPNDYVQCLFEDDNSNVLCEAASGYYTAQEREPRTFSLDQISREKLKKFGFSLDDTQGNFSQTITLASISSLETLATTMLTALHDVYGRNLHDGLDIIAPSAPLSRAAEVKCTPIS